MVRSSKHSTPSSTHSSLSSSSSSSSRGRGRSSSASTSPSRSQSRSTSQRSSSSSSNKNKSLSPSSSSSSSSSHPSSLPIPSISSLSDSSQHSDVHSPLELFYNRNIFYPIVDHLLPKSLHPNYITYCNSITCWTLLFVSLYSGYLQSQCELLRQIESPQLQIYNYYTLLVHLLIIVLIFMAMILDCIDGIHARATGQCSKLGESLDHCIDAANTVIFAVVMVAFLSAENRIITVYSLIATAALYNGQSVLFRHGRVLVDPPVNGPEAQTLLMGSAFLFSLYYYYLYNNNYYHNMLSLDTYHQPIVTSFLLLGNVGTTSNNLFFRKKLLEVKSLEDKGKIVPSPLPFPSHPLTTYYQYVFSLFLFSLLYLLYLVPMSIFLVSLVSFCFYLNGYYVLITILYQRCNISKEKQVELYKKTEYLQGENYVEWVGWWIALAFVGWAYGENHSWVAIFHGAFWVRCVFSLYNEISANKNVLLQKTQINTFH